MARTKGYPQPHRGQCPKDTLALFSSKRPNCMVWTPGKQPRVMVSAQTGGTHLPKRASVSLGSTVSTARIALESTNSTDHMPFLGRGIGEGREVEEKKKNRTVLSVLGQTFFPLSLSRCQWHLLSHSLPRGHEHDVKDQGGTERRSMVGEERIRPSVPSQLCDLADVWIYPL